MQAHVLQRSSRYMACGVVIYCGLEAPIECNELADYLDTA